MVDTGELLQSILVVGSVSLRHIFDGIGDLLRFKLDLRLRLIVEELTSGNLFVWLQLKECVAVWSQVTDHMLFQQEVISRCQMVMLIVFD